VASGHTIWEIGPPLRSRAEGIDEIIAMLERLFQIQRYFLQMTHSGVVTIDGDRATARFVERERGRGDGTHYDNLAVYDDLLVREPGGWRFLERH
jgi:SnoaL-like protein